MRKVHINLTEEQFNALQEVTAHRKSFNASETMRALIGEAWREAQKDKFGYAGMARLERTGKPEKEKSLKQIYDELMAMPDTEITAYLIRIQDIPPPTDIGLPDGRLLGYRIKTITDAREVETWMPGRYLVKVFIDPKTNEETGLEHVNKFGSEIPQTLEGVLDILKKDGKLVDPATV